MNKLVEDIKVGEIVVNEGKNVTVKNHYEVNGEGVGFVTEGENGEEVRFSKSCGTTLKVVV